MVHCDNYLRLQHSKCSGDYVFGMVRRLGTRYSKNNMQFIREHTSGIRQLLTAYYPGRGGTQNKLNCFKFVADY
jgi:hypothetical protein